MGSRKSFEQTVMVLTRPQAQNHRWALDFVAELQAEFSKDKAQFHWIEAPVRAVRFFDHQDWYSQHFDARIITSSTIFDYYQEQFENLPLFVVGKGTESRAVRLGAKILACADTAASLSQRIDNWPVPLHIQWLTGEPYRYDFTQSVKGFQRHDVQKEILYDVQDCAWNASQYAEIAQYDRAIFPVFSQASWEALHEKLALLPDHLQICLLPISKSLQKTILAAQNSRSSHENWQVISAPERPNAQEMQFSLKKMLRNL